MTGLSEVVMIGTTSFETRVMAGPTFELMGSLRPLFGGWLRGPGLLLH